MRRTARSSAARIIRLTGAVLFLSVALLGQGTTVMIFDTAGNTALGTINNGSVFFHDASGKTVVGTISGGSVFLSTDKGETIFGTIRDGSVFLTDSKGTTTGSIHDGYVFLNNSDGSTTTGTIRSGSVFLSNSDGSTTTGTVTTTPPRNPEPTPRRNSQQQQQRQDYEAGYAVGQALGQGLGNGILQARITRAVNKACFNQFAEGWRFPDGTTIRCSDWSAAHPRATKGVPAAVSGVDTLCSANPKAWYKVQSSGLWYSYSCKEWRKHAGSK